MPWPEESVGLTDIGLYEFLHVLVFVSSVDERQNEEISFPPYPTGLNCSKACRQLSQ